MARGAGTLAGRALRGGRWSLLGLALVVTLGGGASIGAAVAAHRTDHAYGDYVEEAEVADLVVNPSLRTQEMDEAIRGFDGVETVRADTLLFASVANLAPTTLSEASQEDSWLQVRGTVDGRYLDVDRPAVTEGRLPSGEREVFVSSSYRSTLEGIVGHPLEVGDELQVGVFWGAVTDVGLDPDTVVEPLGVESLRIVGLGVLPNAVLPEELFPREQIVVSQDVTERYSCLGRLTGATTFEEAVEALIPERCAASYEYYSLTLEDGVGSNDVRRQFDDAVERLNGDLPDQLTSQGVGYYYISEDRADLDAAVRETIRPTVTTLQAFAVVAAVATLTVAGLMVARQTRRDAEVRRVLRAVGATRGEIAWWSTLPPLAAVLAGVAGALLFAWAVSPLGPLGTVRDLTPSPGRSLPVAAALPVALALAAGLFAVIGVVLARAAWRAARSGEPDTRTSRVGRLTRRGRPALTTGVGAALDARRAGAGIAAMVGCIVATAAAATAIVFGASLSALVDQPGRYGWPWDVAVITGAGYGDTNPDVVDDRLSQADVRDDVVDHSFYSFDPSIDFDGGLAPVIFGWQNATDTELPVLEGRMPTAVGELLLGTDTAEQLDLGVGDEVAIESLEFGELDLEVVGLGVLPSAGAFGADRTGLGTGAFTVVDAVADEQRSPALTGIRLRDDVDPAAFVDQLRDELPGWSTNYDNPVAHADPVRSPEIVDVSELRVAPLVLGGALLGSLAVGLWLAISLSVRDRRRELAVLRALGFSDGDVRRSVRWQGLTLVAVGLLVGIPLGIVGGRLAWRFFADRLGVLPQTTIPVSWLAIEIAGTLVLGWLAVLLPARAAARYSPAEELLVP
jgi:hypothetical protein